MQRYTTTLDGDLKPNDSGECYLAADVDAHIAKLDTALRQIYTGASEERDGLHYDEIAEIADKALAGEVVDPRIAELECGIKGCQLPKYHHHLPATHPHHWCKPPGSTS